MGTDRDLPRDTDEETTDPTNPDTDEDGLADGDETGEDDVYTPGEDTDPNDADTDDGGVEDGAEVDGGLDPLDPSDDFSEDTGVIVDTGGINLDGRTGEYLGGCGASSKSALWLGVGMLAWLLGLRRRQTR